jgi:hypothetical protein
MKKKLLLGILGILLIAIAGGLVTFAKKTLPGIAKEKIINILCETTQSKVTIENVDFNIFQGIVLKNLRIFEKGSSTNILCSAKETTVSFLIIPFFKEKQIILPSIKIKSLVLNINRENDCSLNIGYFFEKENKVPEVPAKEKTPDIQKKINSIKLLAQTIQITDSRVFFNDAAITPQAEIQLYLKHLKVRGSWKKLNFEGFAQLSKNDQKTELHLVGSYVFNPSLLLINMTANELDVINYEPYYRNLPVLLKSGKIHNLSCIGALDNNNFKIETKFDADAFSLAKEEFSIDNSSFNSQITVQSPLNDLNKISSQGTLDLKDGFLSFNKDFNLKGSIEKSALDFTAKAHQFHLSGALTLSQVDAEKDKLKLTRATLETSFTFASALTQENNQSISYSGALNIKNADISGIETLDTITGFHSTIKFKNADLIFEDIQARALDTVLSATGTFKNNILTLEGSADIMLEKITPFLNKQFPALNCELNGTALLKIHYASDITSKNPPVISGETQLLKINLTLPTLKHKLSADKGTVLFNTKEENIRWHFSDARYLEKSYKIEGDLKGFKTPHINANLAGQGISLKTNFIKENETYIVTSLKGRYLNSTFDIHGQIKPKKEISLNGSVVVDANDLKTLLPNHSATFKQMKPQGRCSFKAEIAGPLNDIRSWNIKTKATSASLKLYDLTIKDVKLDYAQMNQKGYINEFSFNAYKGQGMIKGNLNLSHKDKTYYLLNGTLKDLELNDLKNDTPAKSKTLYGACFLNISIEGNTQDINSAKGVGSLLIKKGNLWEFNPLKGLGNFLLIPRFTNIVFTNAQGNFTIEDGFLKTDDLELLGPEMGLIAEGKMSFKGDLDFLINTQIIQSGSKETPDQENEVRSQIAQIFSKKGSLTGIKISGTIKEPKYKIQAIAENIIKKFSDIFSNFIP